MRRGDAGRAVGLMREHIEGTEHILAGLLPRRCLGADPLALRVEQRLSRDLAVDPAAEDLDRDLCARARSGPAGRYA